MTESVPLLNPVVRLKVYNTCRKYPREKENLKDFLEVMFLTRGVFLKDFLEVMFLIGGVFLKDFLEVMFLTGAVFLKDFFLRT